MLIFHCNIVVMWTLSSSFGAHVAADYLDNIVEIFLKNIVRLLKYFETYH